MNKYILIGISLFAVLLAFASLDRKRNLAWCAAVRHGTPLVPTEQSKLANSLPIIAIDWSYDTQQKMLHLHLVNNSTKDITAYTISMSKKFADGSSESNVDGTPEFLNAFGTELLGGLIMVQLAKGSVR